MGLGFVQGGGEPWQNRWKMGWVHSSSPDSSCPPKNADFCDCSLKKKNFSTTTTPPEFRVVIYHPESLCAVLLTHRNCTLCYYIPCKCSLLGPCHRFSCCTLHTCSFLWTWAQQQRVRRHLIVFQSRSPEGMSFSGSKVWSSAKSKNNSSWPVLSCAEENLPCAAVHLGWPFTRKLIPLPQVRSPPYGQWGDRHSMRG